jgi:RHS repeat-associated protein
MRATRFFFLLSALMLCSTVLAFAQSSETGLPPFGSFHGSNFDLVSLKSGNLHVEIPLWSLPQRAAPNTGLRLVYDMPSWQVDKSHPTPSTTQWTVAPVSGEKVYWNYFVDPTGPRGTKHDVITKTCFWFAPDGRLPFQYDVHVNYVMTDSHGTKHPFNLRHVVTHPDDRCTDPEPSTDTGFALDGSGYKATITANNGNVQYQMADDIGQFNGNLDSELSTGGSTTIQTGQNNVVLYRIDTVLDSDGNSQQFRVDFGSVTSLTSFCPLLPFQPFPSGTTCVETGSTLNLPQKLTLPNGKFYQFTWSTDGNADLLRIDLPTGGSIAYSYETRLSTPPFQQGGIKQYTVRRRVTSRTVSDGTLPPQTSTYLPGGIVHDPLGNEQVHTFGAPAGGGDDDLSSYEVQVDFYQGTAASGTLLRTIKKDYLAETDPGLSDSTPHGTINARLIRTTTILGDAAQTQSKTESDYETLTGTDGTTYTFLNPIEQREFAYGTVTTPGALLRRTVFTYLHTGNQNYLSRNIVHRVLNTTVYDGSSHQVAQTVNEYDNYSHSGQPMLASNAIQHDPAYDTNFIFRGNVTAVSRWRNTDGAMFTSTNQYDDAGNLLSTIDPLGHRTSFDYTDSWGNTSCTPVGQAKVFATTITNALSQPTSKSHNSCTATIASVTDLNAKTTTFSYDPMNRLKNVTKPDGGATENTYDDTQLLVTSSTVITLPDSRIFSRQHYDLLGRVVQAELCEDGSSACATSIKTDTTYDGIGQISNVSNPYRTANDPGPTNGITRTDYDGVGRVTQITRQDGSLGTMSYDGNCTTAKDEAGNQRKSCTDALGRLIEVDEPGGGNAASPGTGSATASGSEQSIGGPNATPGSGSATVSGSEQSIPGSSATASTGSVTISGLERSVPCGRSRCFDVGGVQITVNGFSLTVNYLQGSTTTGIALALATAFNNNSNSPVTASATNNVVSLTSKATGAASNYSLSATSWTNDPADFSAPSFTAVRSGPTLTGGQDTGPTTYDSGSVWVTVTGFQALATYGQGSTSASVASAIANILNTNGSSPVTASVVGTVITLTARATGASTNYSLTRGSSTSQPGSFASPSFSASVSGSALTGGQDAGPTTYDSGSVWVTVNGFQALASYGQGSTSASVASAIANILNTNGSSPVTASVVGSAITLTARATGASTNYSLTAGSSTSQPGSFASPSFSVSVSGSALTGGSDAALASLNTPYVTLYSYDALGNLVCVEQHGNAATGTGCPATPPGPTDPPVQPDPNNPWRRRLFAYDSLSRLRWASNPESGVISYTYDADGNLLQKTSPAPNQTGTATQTVSYCYDALHRVLGKGYGAQSCPLATPVVTYAYDSGINATGHLISMTDQAGIATYTYDVMGRLATEARTLTGANNGTISKNVSYEYNVDGSLYKLHYPSGKVVTYTPDLAGRTVSAVDSGSGTNYVTGATYAPSSALASFISGSGGAASITNSFTYNQRLQPIAMSATMPGQTLFSISYDFHAGNGTAGSGADNGNVSGITNNKDITRSQTFAYDALNRLTSAQNAGTDCGATVLEGKKKFWGNTYTYDAWGNLTNKVLIQTPVPACSGEGLSVAAGANNRLGSGYLYDAAGNMTFNATPPTQTYAYDEENRLTGAAGFTYTYDGDGNRVRKSNGNTAPDGTLYWYMAPGVVAESDLAGTLKSEYVFFDGERVARRDGPTGAGGVFYYFSDHLKTASVITDSAGVIKAESDYYPWGGELKFVDNDSNDYKFTGKKRDVETGLDYFGARYYSNGLGRWVSADWSATPVPVPYADFGDPQSLNLYGYVRNVPTAKNDIDGHCPDGMDVCFMPQLAQDKNYMAGYEKGGKAGLALLLVAATGGWAARSPLIANLLGLALVTAPKTVPVVTEILEGATPGSPGFSVRGAAETLGIRTFEKIGESGAIGALENGAKLSVGFERAGSNLGVSISNIETATKGSINFKALEAGAQKVAEQQGASSVTVKAVSVINDKLAQTLTKAGYTAQKVTDSFGRETINYIKTISIKKPD